MAVYSPLLEGVLTVKPTKAEALAWMQEYGKENPGEVVRLIENYPM